MAYLEDGVQGMLHLSKALLPTILSSGWGECFRMSPLSDFWAFSVQAIKAEKENQFSNEAHRLPWNFTNTAA